MGIPDTERPGPARLEPRKTRPGEAGAAAGPHDRMRASSSCQILTAGTPSQLAYDAREGLGFCRNQGPPRFVEESPCSQFGGEEE